MSNDTQDVRFGKETRPLMPEPTKTEAERFIRGLSTADVLPALPAGVKTIATDTHAETMMFVHHFGDGSAIVEQYGLWDLRAAGCDASCWDVGGCSCGGES